ncbi:MAG: glycosyltransferase [Candidatus Woesearchaeota archaeon]
METDIIMVIGSVLFAILFAFLIFVFVTAVISFFKKRDYPDFEPNISIIIPCYNEENNIRKTIKSLHDIDYPKEKTEIIIIDDGSTDNTLDILKKEQDMDSRIKILKGNHEGKSASLNLGVKESKHEFILTVDADTILAKDSLKKIARPFSDPSVGAVNGSCVAKNSNTIMSMFQNIEYHYNNLIRRSFSVLFNNGIWFFGAFMCYRKDVLEKIGYFKQDTMTEDMDTAMEIYAAGYRAVNVHDAIGYTIVPGTLMGFSRQRARWWIGGLQTLKKNKKLFSIKSSPSIIFLFISYYWWTLFAIMSLPIIIYQINYWLPSNMGSFYTVFMYLFRWFTLLGPVYVIYKIPEWGISLYSIFGVMSGIISVFLIVKSIYMFKDNLTIKNIFAIFFYFPYTIILNSIIVISLIKLIFLKKSYFIN